MCPNHGIHKSIGSVLKFEQLSPKISKSSIKNTVSDVTLINNKAAFISKTIELPGVKINNLGPVVRKPINTNP